jgi:hypothetical protein
VLSSIGNRSVTVGDSLTLTLSASDPNTVDTLTFSKSAGSVGTLTGSIYTFTPTEADTGDQVVTFTVTDNGSPALSDAETITITVSAAAGSSSDSSTDSSSSDSGNDTSGGTSDTSGDDTTSTSGAPANGTTRGGAGGGSCFISGCFSSEECKGGTLVFLAVGLGALFASIKKDRKGIPETALPSSLHTSPWEKEMRGNKGFS